MRKFFRWAGTSAFRCVAMVELCFSLPLWMVFSYESAMHEGLTLVRWLYIGLVGAVCGALGGLAFWHISVKPLRKRLGIDKEKKR
jgi:hypothetical protein